LALQALQEPYEGAAQDPPVVLRLHAWVSVLGAAWQESLEQ
jgi:hypothetical protein